MTDQQLLQNKFDRLLNLTRRVRGIQKEYFKYRARSDLDLMKRAQYELDKFIEQEVREQKSKQEQISFRS